MKKINIRKILVPIDFTETSDIALAEATSLAIGLKADILLLNVVESTGYNYSVFAATETIPPSLNDLEGRIRKKMEVMKGQIVKKFGIKCSTFVVSGHIHTEINNFANMKKVDLIVMGTHGASGFKEYFIGSNSQRVITLSDIPVLTTQRKSNKTGFKNILIPLDNSIHSREKVNIAIIIAKLYNSKIHLLGLPDSRDKNDVAKFKIKMASVERLIESDELQYESNLAHGSNLAETAIKYATKNKCDLIVINTGHESKITGVFMGAFSQQIVNHSLIPVLSYKHTYGQYSIDTPGFGIM